MNKNKFLFQLLFFIRKDFYLRAFAFLSNFFYLASFLTNKLFSEVIRNKDLESLLLKHLQSVIKNYEELENEVFNVLENSS